MIHCEPDIRIKSDLLNKLEKKYIKALEKTAEAIHTEVVQSQVIPFKTGNLQNESTFVDYGVIDSGEASIVSSTPYARRLYYHPEYNFSIKENPNAKGKWFEDWVEGGSKEDFAQNAFNQFLKQEMK